MSSSLRVLVTGSRTWTDAATVWLALELARERAHLFGARMILIHGHCPKGADEIADRWGRERVEVWRFPANWKLGRTAGVKRNTQMIDISRPHLGLAFHRNNSRGTAHCVSEMRTRGIPVVRMT